MTATYRLKGLGWLAIAVIAALGFYLVSLQVSVERKKLEHVNHEIAQARDDLRSLQTEFSTRANLAQLETWNGDVLALTAPTAAQYMTNGQQLASLGSEGSDGVEVQMASLVIPTLPMIAPPADDEAPATDTRSTPPAPATPKAMPAKVEMASAKPAADPLAAIVRAAAARSAKSSAASHAKEQAMAMLDRKLLSDATLGDLMSKARAETASLR